ncbi:hypothetical protein ACFQDE_03745 [Deinococcus caeni]|uniref:hypothetical protein n=1 Tax=Deinococcus caeni TaxID=569127 RepID=UPI003611B6A6
MKVSMSTPRVFVKVGSRPPVTSVPPPAAPVVTEMVELNTSLTGLTVFDTVFRVAVVGPKRRLPCGLADAPSWEPRSPSYATTPMVLLTVPTLGVMNPLTEMSTGTAALFAWRKPSNTARFRVGWAGLRYATTSVQLAQLLLPAVLATFPAVYRPLPPACTRAVTSTNDW